MSIEPYQARTVHLPRVYAKDAPRATITRPKLSMAEDARRCNARFAIKWGAHNGGGGNTHNQNMAEARTKRDATLGPIILAILSKGPASKATIAADLSSAGHTTSDTVAGRVLRTLREEGRVRWDRLTLRWEAK
jgi:hypothetical protein